MYTFSIVHSLAVDLRFEARARDFNAFAQSSFFIALRFPLSLRPQVPSLSHWTTYSSDCLLLLVISQRSFPRISHDRQKFSLHLLAAVFIPIAAISLISNHHGQRHVAEPREVWSFETFQLQMLRTASLRQFGIRLVWNQNSTYYVNTSIATDNIDHYKALTRTAMWQEHDFIEKNLAERLINKEFYA